MRTTEERDLASAYEPCAATRSSKATQKSSTIHIGHLVCEFANASDATLLTCTFSELFHDIISELDTLRLLLK